MNSNRINPTNWDKPTIMNVSCIDANSVVDTSSVVEITITIRKKTIIVLTMEAEFSALLYSVAATRFSQLDAR